MKSKISFKFKLPVKKYKFENPNNNKPDVIELIIKYFKVVSLFKIFCLLLKFKIKIQNVWISINKIKVTTLLVNNNNFVENKIKISNKNSS